MRLAVVGVVVLQPLFQTGLRLFSAGIFLAGTFPARTFPRRNIPRLENIIILKFRVLMLLLLF